jgi:hypothetical protein
MTVRSSGLEGDGVSEFIDPDTAWMTGQIINAEGGFRRSDH